MDSDEENRLLYHHQLKSHKPDRFDHHQMIENKKENQEFDQESSDNEVEKMSEKPFSSYSELHEGKSKIKINGASGSAKATGSGSSVRICDFCGKQFNSGKALGGHRRYHIQAQKKLEAQNQAQQQRQEKVNYTLRIKPKDLVIRHYDNNNLIKSIIGNLNCSSSRSFPCCVCDKDFPSEKSLYGHMRSHPEREWRGMNPPFVTTDNDLASSPSTEQVNNGSSSSTFEESSSPGPVDLSSSCSGSSWLKKDKRGRKIIGEAEAAHIAAHTLMCMYLYGNDELEIQNLCCPCAEPTPEEAALLPVKKRKNNVMKKNYVADYKEKSEGRDGDDELEAENNTWDVKVISLIKEKKLNKKMNKKLKLGTEMIKSEGESLMIRTVKQEEVKPSQTYVCDICNKSFTCFQALGGHKSKHNREKNMAKSMKGKEVVEQRGGGGGGEDKIYINGALLSSAGLSGEEEEEEEEASLMSSEERLLISSNDNNEDNSNEEEVGEASQQSGSKIRGFDLNEPYVLEHEATEI